MHQLVRDLHTPNPRIYWSDVLLTAVIGWTAFVASVLFRLWSWPMLTAFLISVLALYRGLCFVHEISHLRMGSLRKLQLVWNVLFGMPLLLPSFMYVGVHQYHHGLATYGTERDPEYLPFAGKPLMISVFIVQGLLIPLALLVRFLLLAPIGLVYLPLHRWVSVHFSSLCMNVKFRRDTSIGIRRMIRRLEILTLILWTAAAAVGALSHVALRGLLTWYAVSACAAVVNVVRALGAHRYESDGTPLDRDEQLTDSIDTPGAFWTELWAPVGLRYHALHHYFPGIPYHNLGKAYRRLTENLPPEALYRITVSPGLHHSLAELCRSEPT
jgi:fatty acid desaturase